MASLVAPRVDPFRVCLSAEMFAKMFTETSFPSQVLPLQIMSRLHWPASGALWDLQFFKAMFILPQH